MDKDELTAWLVLSRAPGLGQTGLGRLLEVFPGPRALLAGAGPGLDLAPSTLAYLRAPDQSQIASDLLWLDQPGHALVTLADPRYPPLLRQIADPPPILYVVGDPEVLSQAQLAMVGSRNPTPGGAQTAYDFARHLAADGLVITSGLALGIDSACHRGALDGGGLTVAVAGTGLDLVYPGRHRDLAHRIAREGALVSEYPLGTSPRPGNFPRRNRIISGLALGTLVMEAAAGSGSLITARLAVEQGREVLAVPGSIHNPLARGCHALIRQGARLVETAADVLEELAPLLPGPTALDRANAAATMPAAPAEPDQPDLNPEYRTLLEHMGHDPVAVDTLVERSGLTPEAVSSMLLLLELQGHVAPLSAGRYARLAKRT